VYTQSAEGNRSTIVGRGGGAAGVADHSRDPRIDGGGGGGGGGVNAAFVRLERICVGPALTAFIRRSSITVNFGCRSTDARA